MWEWEVCRGEKGWGGWGLCIGDSTILVKIVTGGCGKVAPPVRCRGGNRKPKYSPVVVLS